jgi:hypothetical protein
LASLGTLTHWSRNLGHPLIPINRHKHGLGRKNTHASALKKCGTGTSGMKRLHGDLDMLDKELNKCMEKPAKKYSMKVKDVRQHMFTSSTYKMHHKPSLYNTKISVIMADINTGKPSFLFFFLELTHLDMS